MRKADSFVERKYQLEKEMQETLDPNVGKSEIEELTK
jgi:hypothetical protein